VVTFVPPGVITRIMAEVYVSIERVQQKVGTDFASAIKLAQIA
jgi:hypothetical protein